MCIYKIFRNNLSITFIQSGMVWPEFAPHPGKLISLKQIDNKREVKELVVSEIKLNRFNRAL